ncbi:MAG: hypothetical protein GY928_28440 [Colwellia sp.]|nr:hypothetical protein [Colwellia sp.]
MSKEKVILKGDFVGKTFEGKELVYRGDDFLLDNCSIFNCQFILEGKALIGLEFLQKLYSAGEKYSVLSAFLTDEEYEIVKDALGWHGKDGN